MSSRTERALMIIEDESIRAAIVLLFKEVPASFAPPSAIEANERIQFAVIKLANAGLKYFDLAAKLYRVDARDLLLAANFGDPEAHKNWYKEVVRKGNA